MVLKVIFIYLSMFITKNSGWYFGFLPRLLLINVNMQVDFLENQTESLFTVILSSGSELYFDVYVDVLLYNLTALDSQTRNSRGLFSLPAKLGTIENTILKIQFENLLCIY